MGGLLLLLFLVKILNSVNGLCVKRLNSLVVFVAGMEATNKRFLFYDYILPLKLKKLVSLYNYNITCLLDLFLVKGNLSGSFSTGGFSLIITEP